MECKIVKDNYSSSLKSMSKTILPLLIILTMTHMMEFMSGAAFVSVTWDVVWVLVTLTFFSNLHMVREYICLYKPMRWQGSSVDGSWIFRHPGVLLFLSKFAERSKWYVNDLNLYANWIPGNGAKNAYWYLLTQIEYEGFHKCTEYHCSILPGVF
jgi:hypothetical protein